MTKRSSKIAKSSKNHHSKKNNNFLENINFPRDLKQLSIKNLPQVSQELRELIIKNAEANGGHFGSSLGVVELTVALHYVFNTPNDKIVWDVGHQAYGHKILTGRKNKFHSNRKKEGIAGFPKPSESEYDAFVAGHASVSISAALGMATASKLKNENRKHIAVIGDGALTGGLAFEGLNNAGDNNADLLVILNDNQISIDPNVGALKNYLVKITTSSPFNSLRTGIKEVLQKTGKIGKNIDAFAEKIEKSLKQIVFNYSNFFEALNFCYFGPVYGHDVKKLVEIMEKLKKVKGPKLLHILTTKGKGFKPAELQQTKWHATSGFNKLAEEEKISDKISSKLINNQEFPEKLEPQDLTLNKNIAHKCCENLVCKNPKSRDILKYQEIFGHTLVELAEKNKNIVGITPAMPTGSSVDIMMKKFPDRAFDVGICEAHAVTFSAGLALQGLTPFCNIYSTFAQRAYDQFIHDIAIEKTPVIFCLDRGGLVGEDGETHHGVFDLAYLRPIPNIIISAPLNEEALRNLMYTASEQKDAPFFIRYTRGKGTTANWQTKFKKISIGKARQISAGKDLAILSLGAIGNEVIKAINIYKEENTLAKKSPQLPAHFDMQFLKPLDEELLHQICKKYKKIITIEEGCKFGGLGSTVAEFIVQNNYTNKLEILGVPDQFIKHATAEEQRDQCGISAQKIALKMHENL